jgi:RNA polymerase sigma-70 factor (ECF subfamily)
LFDKEIIEQCRSGNLQDFRKLVEEVSPFAFSVAFRMLGDEESAMDIVQETMITLWGKIWKLNSAEHFKMWLYKIVLNKCYDELRKKKRNPELNPDGRTWELIANKISENPSTAMENNEISRIINLLSARLSPKQKAVFILSDIDELSVNEISYVTGMSSLNVKANLHYARKKIAEMIEKYI